MWFICSLGIFLSPQVALLRQTLGDRVDGMLAVRRPSKVVTPSTSRAVNGTRPGAPRAGSEASQPGAAAMSDFQEDHRTSAGKAWYSYRVLSFILRD